MIIGAGPAGLAAAVCLATRGVDHVLLERPGGAAIRKVDPQMRLLSPKRLSRLPGMKFPASSSYPTFDELVRALAAYRDEHALVTQACDVSEVVSSAKGFGVRGSEGAF